jgi:hypothetical protein
MSEEKKVQIVPPPVHEPEKRIEEGWGRIDKDSRLLNPKPIPNPPPPADSDKDKK